MKKFKTTLAFALALILCAVSALPAFAAVRAEILPAWIVPSGYKAHE